MDESAFRAARGAIDRQPCVFEKALLARCAYCRARRLRGNTQPLDEEG